MGSTLQKLYCGVWIHYLKISMIEIFEVLKKVPWTSNTFKGKGKGKGKTVPLQVWSGPEGSRKLMFPDFVTMAR